VDDQMSAADEPQQVTVVFRQPVVQPGTPEAQARGCPCGFESNMAAGFLTAERGYENEVLVVIHKAAYSTRSAASRWTTPSEICERAG
jgi:hypothetical protein